MGFKKIRYINSEELIETKITDGTGRVISKWKCHREDYPKVVKILNDKFSLNMRIITKNKSSLDWAL